MSREVINGCTAQRAKGEHFRCNFRRERSLTLAGRWLSMFVLAGGLANYADPDLTGAIRAASAQWLELVDSQQDQAFCSEASLLLRDVVSPSNRAGNLD